MTANLQQKLHQIRLMTVDQLRQSIAQCDEKIATTKNQMKTMGTLFKLKTAIPKLRDLDAIRRRLVAELDSRKVREKRASVPFSRQNDKYSQKV